MNVQHFIDKFEAIPEENWCVGIHIDDQGRRCAWGHLLPEGMTKDQWAGTIGGWQTPEGIKLANIIDPYLLVSINNGIHLKYQQETPKQRALAALRDIQLSKQQDKAVEEANQLATIPICEECGKPVTMCDCEDDEDDEVEDWGAGSIEEKVCY